MQDVARMEQAMLELADEVESWAPEASMHRVCHTQTLEIARRIREKATERRGAQQ